MLIKCTKCGNNLSFKAESCPQCGCLSVEMEKIIIDDSTTTIDDEAFIGCNSLTSIVIPNSVSSIGWGTFQGCSSLTSVVIPDSVTYIEGNAFWGCSSLISVTAPEQFRRLFRN